MTAIKIEPKLVSVYPTEKTAEFLYINEISLLLVDEGVTVIYQLTNLDGVAITPQERVTLSNAELSNWTTSDTQLVDALITKLGLVKVIL